MLINWGHAFVVNHSHLDEQHNQLVQVVNGIAFAHRNGGDTDSIKVLLHRFARDSKHHFESEEAVMRETAYPLKEEHMLEHAGLLRRLTDIITPYQDPGKGICGDGVASLREWLLDHMDTADRKFGEFLADQKAGHHGDRPRGTFLPS